MHASAHVLAPADAAPPPAPSEADAGLAADVAAPADAGPSAQPEDAGPPVPVEVVPDVDRVLGGEWWGDLPVELGVLDDDAFEPLARQDELEIVQGPQGGIHVEVALRFEAPELPATTTVAIEASTVMDSQQVGTIVVPKLTVTGMDGGAHVTSVVPVIFEEDHASVYLGDALVPEPATVCATITLADGRAAEVCQEVTLVDEL